MRGRTLSLRETRLSDNLAGAREWLDGPAPETREAHRVLSAPFVQPPGKDRQVAASKRK
jgi:hypothetical protein